MSSACIACFCSVDEPSPHRLINKHTWPVCRRPGPAQNVLTPPADERQCYCHGHMPHTPMADGCIHGQWCGKLAIRAILINEHTWPVCRWPRPSQNAGVSLRIHRHEPTDTKCYTLHAHASDHSTHSVELPRATPDRLASAIQAQITTTGCWVPLSVMTRARPTRLSVGASSMTSIRGSCKHTPPTHAASQHTQLEGQVLTCTTAHTTS